jgi:hypothetical protein
MPRTALAAPAAPDNKPKPTNNPKVTVRAVRREEVDIEKLVNALILLLDQMGSDREPNE